MNRPFGAVDVAANLKGAVPKAATQKILVALAERGDIVQKTYGAYPCPSAHLRVLHPFLAVRLSRRNLELICDGATGKTTFFVANQAHLADMPAATLQQLEAEHKAIEDANKERLVALRAANAGTSSRPYVFASSTPCECAAR